MGAEGEGCPEVGGGEQEVGWCRVVLVDGVEVQWEAEEGGGGLCLWGWMAGGKLWCVRHWGNKGRWFLHRPPPKKHIS